MQVKAVLRRLPCFQLAGEASSGSEAITLVDEVHPALVLMDINMPEMNGIEATRRIVAAHPDIVVFLCSTHDVTDLPPWCRRQRRPRLHQQGALRRRRPPPALAGPRFRRLRPAVTGQP
jgi:CheY-like chemotaxis protein